VNVYPDSIFQRVLVNRFALVCGNSGLGLWALKRFLKFSLLNYNNYNLTEIVKLLIKTISRG
jgi:hypothetical protein